MSVVTSIHSDTMVAALLDDHSLGMNWSPIGCFLGWRSAA